MYFEYDDKALHHLKAQDPQLAAVIDEIGYIQRSLDEDLFTSVIRHIVGQQISTKAQQTVWNRIKDHFGELTADKVTRLTKDEWQQFGMTYRKAENILDYAQQVQAKTFDIEAVTHMNDEAAIKQLTQLKGVGIWTAEMILIFGLQRPNVFSFGDLAIRKGVRMVYQLEELTPQEFQRIHDRLTPYASIASLYFWQVAKGAIPTLQDPQQAK